jgi:hypothetical protein
MAKPPLAPHVKKKLQYIATPTITECIFCGAKPPLTQEHIFSHWTHRYLPNARMGKYDSVRGIRNPHDLDHVVINRPGDIRDWTIRCVCEKTCNNGWMRQLVEDHARPVLLPLIRGEAFRISPAQQQLIATWATMKAMVAEWGQRGHVTTNHMQRKRMMWRQLPPEKNWGVWIGRFVSDSNKPESERYHPKWESHPFLLLPDRLAAKYPNKIATYFNSQSSTQVIGEFFVHILRSPMPNLIPRWKFALPNRGTLFRIWPRTETSIVWPQRTMTDLDAVYVANAFMNYMLGLQREAGIGR